MRARGTVTLGRAKPEDRALPTPTPTPAAAYVVAFEAGEEQTWPVLYVGPEIEGMLGYAVEEWLGDPDLWNRLLHPDDRERVLAEAADAAASGDRFGARYRLRGQDGRVVSIRDQASLVRDETGRPRFWQGVVLDVTDQARAEEALRASEGRFRALVEQSSDLISVIDAGGVRRYASPAYERVLGYRPDDLVGLPIEAINHPDDADLDRRFFAALARRPGAVDRFEARVLHRDGSARWLEAVATNRLDERLVGGIVINSRDITERKRADEARGEGQRRERAFAAAARRQARDLALLHRVRTALARELALPDLLHAVVEAVAEALGYTQVSLFLREGDELVLQHHIGYDRVVARIPVSVGVTGRVVRSGEPVLIEDVSADPDFICPIGGVVSEICVPLRDAGRVAGVLNVESTNGVRLTEDDLRLLLALGAHVDVAIERARLYGEVQASEARFRTLVQNVSDIIAVADADGALRPSSGCSATRPTTWSGGTCSACSTRTTHRRRDAPSPPTSWTRAATTARRPASGTGTAPGAGSRCCATAARMSRPWAALS